MIGLFTFVVAILVLQSPLSQAQSIEEWCADSPPPSEIDPEWRTIPDDFEILAELVHNNEVMEITQAFSPNRDSIVKNSAADHTSYYWNFRSGEHLEVTTNVGSEQRKPQCKRSLITSDTQTSIIKDGTLLLKPSVLFGFNPRNERDSSWGIRYNSDGTLRNIPTKIFQSCFNISDINGIVKVTYHVSDVNKFQAYLSDNESLILQLDVNVTNGQRQEAYVYNVFRYIPNPYEVWEQQELETPSGVYCTNRTSTKAVPSNLPDRIISNSEGSLSSWNNSIFSSHNLYDSEFLYSRFDVWFPNSSSPFYSAHVTEIHDFAIGLSYQFNHTTHQCSVSDINENTLDAVPVDGESNLFQMGVAQHLFLMDDITYQYVGEKRCRDRVWCDVWIGENQYQNHTVEHREWYWAIRINDIDLQAPIPMKLIMKRYVGGVLNFTAEINIFNYRPNSMSIFEIDYTLADCFRALGPTNDYNLGVLSFTITNDQKFPVAGNLNTLRCNIWETVMFTLFIRPIRLSHLIVDEDGSDILVTFTLLDAPPRTGPVEVPLIESTLDTLIERLSKIIDNNGLIFRPETESKKFLLRARPSSLNVAHRSTENNTRSTGPLIIGLWIGCGLAGILIGAVVSFFIFARVAPKQT